MRIGSVWINSIVLRVVLAHTRFTTLHINSVSQGDFTCIRSDRNIGTTTNYINSLTSADAVCGVDGLSSVPVTCDANAGDKISLEHRQVVDAPSAGAIDASHLGSTAVYMKRLSSVSDSGLGDGWFKISWIGYNTPTKRWGTEEMMANNGKVDATVSSDLPSGIYLIRSEVVSLQNVVGDSVLPQMYVGCAQVRINSTSDTTIKAQTVTIPGHVNDQSPAMNFNIYKRPLSLPFIEFGPSVYTQDIPSNPAESNAKHTASTPESSAASTNPSPQPVVGAETSNSAVKPGSVERMESADHMTTPETSRFGTITPESIIPQPFTGRCRSVRQPHSPWSNWHQTRNEPLKQDAKTRTVVRRHEHESAMQRRNRLVGDRMRLDG